MNDLKKINEVFNDSYQIAKKFYLSERTDDDLTQVAIDVDKIRKKHNCEFAVDILVATVNEVHRIATMKK